MGKTYVGVRLAIEFRGRGVDVGVMKPVETGCEGGAPADAKKLLEASGADDPIELVCPYRLKRPLAPAIAAEKEGISISKRTILNAFHEVRNRHEMMLVEGAGGLLVPVTGKLLMADLAIEMGLKLLVVAANLLGCVNKTLLTLEAARSRGLEIAAVVLNQIAPPDKSSADNERLIRKWGKVKTLAVFFNSKQPLNM